jgi:hypothetical protein
MPFLKTKTILLRALGIAALASMGSQASASGPAFLVSISNNSPRLSEMMEVTTEPFGTNVISTTNGGIIYINTAPWSAMAFDPAGTLYGIITSDSGLGNIDPATAAYSVFTNLHLTANAPGAEDLVYPTSMAISTNGTAYVTDGGNLYTANLASGLCSNVNPFSVVGSGGLPIVLALAEAPNGTMFGLWLGLSTIDLTNAQVTQIGEGSTFGGGNNPIYALSAAFGSDGNLYMVGWDNARTNHPKLYQVNTNDGTATALGSLPFGAQGLAALSPTNTGAPAIVVPPASQTVMAGTPVAFSVTGSGTPAPTVQWYFGGAEDPGATNSILTIGNASPTNAGSYFVVLSNTNGQATSQVVTLTVTPGILASTGAAGDFTNSILGLTTNPPTEAVLMLQNSNLFFSNLSFDPRGELFGMGQQLIFSGSNHVSGSQDVLFAINTQTWTTNFIGDFQTNAGAGPQAPIGLAFSPSGILYASAGGILYSVDESTAQRTKVGTFTNSVAIGAMAFAPDGTLFGGETNLYKINPTNASVITNIGALNGVSASILADMKYGADGFLYFFDGGSDGNLYRLNPTNAQVSLAANYPSALSGLAFVPIPTVIVTEPTNQIVITNAAANFSVTATGTAPLEYQWFFDKVAIKDGTNSTLAFPNASARNDGTYYVVVSNALGSVTGSVVTLTTYVPPAITRVPKSEVITTGQTISLSVAATGSTLRYQWQLNGTNLPGKTAASLIIGNARTNDAGTYTIVVSVPSVATPATASATAAVLPLKPTISSPVNNSMIGTTNSAITGREPANGGAAAILYQLNSGPVQAPEVSSNGLTWSAPVSLAPGTNAFLVWATNASGSSATVKASYVLNPFIPVAGPYYGLFFGSNTTAFSNSGYFHLTLESDRVFSGDILLAGAMTSLTGRFDTNGVAAMAVGSPAQPKYDLALQLDLSGSNPLTGSVSNIALGWTASLSAVRAAFSGTLPATNYEGTYLLAINGGPNAEGAPVGYSYARATINSAGVVTLSGTTADGALFTDVGTAISQNGVWPLYAPLHAGKGSVLAWVMFPMHSAANQTTSGQALWFETAGANGHFYTNGFSLLTNQLGWLVNRYVPPARGVAVLPSGNYTAQIFGGNLSANLNENITITSNNAVVSPNPNTNKFSLTINASQGTFSGSFVGPGNSAPTALKGVLLPDSNEGLGYFLGPNQGGGILIQP